MAGSREVIEMKGVFCALYSDRGSPFLVTRKAGEKVDKNRVTQVGRAMKDLGVRRRRGAGKERRFGTWQGGLPQELRLAEITSVQEAHTLLRERYIKEFNEQFRVAAAQRGTAFRRTSRNDPNWNFTVQAGRVVGKDNTVANGRTVVANRQDTLYPQPGRKQCNNTRASGREHLDPVRTTCCGTV